MTEYVLVAVGKGQKLVVHAQQNRGAAGARKDIHDIRKYSISACVFHSAPGKSLMPVLSSLWQNARSSLSGNTGSTLYL